MRFGPYSPALKKFTNFWGAHFERCFQFWPTHSTTLQCNQIKLLWEAFLQGTYLSDIKPNKIWNLDPIQTLKRNCPILRWLIWKAAFSFAPTFAWPYSVTKSNSCGGFLVQPTYLSDKQSKSNMKFVAFSVARNKLTNFWWADLESCFQVWPKHSTTLQCQKMKLLWRNFGSANLPFREKKTIKFEIWTLFASSKEIYQFWGGSFGKLLSLFANTFHNPSVSQKKNYCQKLCFRQLTFQIKTPIKSQIWTLFTHSKEIAQFWGGWFGKQHSVLAQCLHGPLVSQNELL